MMINRNVTNIFKIFEELRVNPDFLKFDSSGFNSLPIGDFTEKISFAKILETAIKLSQLKDCKGFNSLSSGFNNPSEFHATMFVVDCAYLIYNLNEVVQLEFSPSVEVKGRNKKPDFCFDLRQGVQIFCECKSLMSITRIKTSKARRLLEHIEVDLREE